MSTTNMPSRDDPADRRSLRVVLFGLPDAGKSSLLGALAQAAEYQERLLRGRLFDVTSGLAELRRRVYQERPRETTDEIVPYPVRYEPLKGNKPDPSSRIDLVLYDCDGRAANDILAHGPAFHDVRSKRLVHSLLGADAIVLLIDASASDEQIERDFAEFERFLAHFKQHRTRETEIAGLPVFLVLSKCDLLVQPGDTQSAWLVRIQERRAEVAQRYEEALRRHQRATTGFGTLLLEVVGTAVRRPAEFGVEASREPFGVAELFSRVFVAAKDYRDRKTRARRRLWVTFLATAILVLGLVAGAIGLLWTREQLRPIALAGIVENYRSRENPTPSSRLTEPLQRKISELTDIQKHPDFPRLPEEQRRYVDERLAELLAYQDFKTRLERERSPADLLHPDDLTALESRLRDSLIPPEPYASDWSQTEAELLRQKWLEDIRLIREAAARVIETYARQVDEAGQLLRLQSPSGQTLRWDDWFEAAESLLRRSSQRPFRETDPLPGSRSLPALRAPAVTFASIMAQSPVARALGDWESARIRLHRMFDIASALGLGGRGNELALLRFEAGYSFDQLAQRLEAVRRVYPNFQEWTIDEITPQARPDIQNAAARSYLRLIESARQRITREFLKLAPDGKESREVWLSLARWIADAAEFNEARSLFRVLQRLAGEPVEDLAATLSGFLQQNAIPLQIRTVRVVIPDDAHTSRLRPSGDLVMTQVPPGGTPQTFRFRREDESLRENRERRTTYAFSAESGSSSIQFLPGSVFYVELDVKNDSGQVWRLSWLQCRSQVYRYEALFGQPRFHKPDAANPLEGQRVDIRLRFSPEGGVPPIPTLLPDVNR